MDQDALDEERGIAETALAGVGDILQPADDLSDGVLDQWQVEALDLRPELGNVVQVLGIHAELPPDRHFRFLGAEVLFGLVLAPLDFQQPLFSPDSADGFHTERQRAQVFEALSAKMRGGRLQADHLLP
ncbi:MAG: hypothetical protein CO096_26020, partial [Armatimonadetes bacterium CG_4_9_14_3_um_filter_66_14]